MAIGRRKRKKLGATHPDTLQTLNNLGSIHFVQGKASAAETCFMEALAGRRAVLGVTHADTIQSLDNLGALYLSEGEGLKGERLEEAARIVSWALQAKQQTLGDTHLSTLQTLHDVGVIRYHQKQWEESASFFQFVLKGKKIPIERHASITPFVNFMFHRGRAGLRTGCGSY